MRSDRRPRPADATARAKASIAEAVARGIEPATTLDDDDLLDRLDGKPNEPRPVVSPGDNTEIGDRPFNLR